ncbi:MAG: single-stranded-DNA-specific exonuclease C-terminal domain-containing protein [Alkalibacterium sp.]|nr:single-stranded-DNA-specific exonuclease C-terminal domain-containing protein [Alkalibacterium sp.]
MLRPFGQDNPKPLMKIESVYPENSKKIGASQTHFKATLSRKEKKLDMIAFNSADWSDILKSSPEIDVIGFISINEWNGFRKVQLQAIDYKSKEPLIIDQRKSSIQEKCSRLPGSFSLFQSDVAGKWVPKIAEGSTYQIIDGDSQLLDIDPEKAVIIVDTPLDVDDFRRIYQAYTSNPIYLYFHSPNDYYLKGIPKKQHFQKLYKWLLRRDHPLQRHQRDGQKHESGQRHH